MGTIQILGQMPYSSNRTFLAEVTNSDTGAMLKAIYKPHRGERALWDFPAGLYLREVAAYILSDTLGWGLIPETVLRVDGPYGEGSLQLFIDADFTEHYFSLFEKSNLHDQFRMFALFDIIANNADRKSGHLLIDDTNHVWGIDQGLCFHAQPKLRTVIWEFAGEDVPSNLISDLSNKRTQILAALDQLLDSEEIEALERRIWYVVKTGRFPIPDPEMRCYPWPLV